MLYLPPAEIFENMLQLKRFGLYFERILNSKWLLLVSTNCVSQIVDNLECGKSAGPDGICAEHLKFSNHKISILLALCFTVCLCHGYLPTALIKTTIVPIVKNKSGNLSDSNNYRPIALAAIVSKILESVILIKCGNLK